MAMKVLNGLPERYGSLIKALGALGDEKQFGSDIVKNSLFQAEKRINQCIESPLKISQEDALSTTQREIKRLEWNFRDN